MIGAPFIRLARSRWDKKILCPHVVQTRPISAPRRTTFHSCPPQGWALRRITRSFSSIFSILSIIKQFRKTRKKSTNVTGLIKKGRFAQGRFLRNRPWVQRIMSMEQRTAPPFFTYNIFTKRCSACRISISTIGLKSNIPKLGRNERIGSSS